MHARPSGGLPFVLGVLQVLRGWSWLYARHAAAHPAVASAEEHKHLTAELDQQQGQQPDGMLTGHVD